MLDAIRNGKSVARFEDVEVAQAYVYILDCVHGDMRHAEFAVYQLRNETRVLREVVVRMPQKPDVMDAIEGQIGDVYNMLRGTGVPQSVRLAMFDRAVEMILEGDGVTAAEFDYNQTVVTGEQRCVSEKWLINSMRATMGAEENYSE